MKQNELTSEDSSRTSIQGGRGSSFGSGGHGGDNARMNRLAHLEKRVDVIDGRLGRIEKDVDTLKGDVIAVKTTLASIDAKLDIGSIRASVERAHTDIYKWIVSIIAVIGAIYFGLQRMPPAASPWVYSFPPSQPQAMPAPLAPVTPPSSP
ncbi:hypothetical protein [Achromobacter deleyi]|nr:hypothetical protein [Achromobacter deleyi]